MIFAGDTCSSQTPKTHGLTARLSVIILRWSCPWLVIIRDVVSNVYLNYF